MPKTASWSIQSASPQSEPEPGQLQVSLARVGISQPAVAGWLIIGHDRMIASKVAGTQQSGSSGRGPQNGDQNRPRFCLSWRYARMRVSQQYWSRPVRSVRWRQWKPTSQPDHVVEHRSGDG